MFQAGLEPTVAEDDLLTLPSPSESWGYGHVSLCHVTWTVLKGTGCHFLGYPVGVCVCMRVYCFCVIRSRVCIFDDNGRRERCLVLLGLSSLCNNRKCI